MNSQHHPVAWWFAPVRIIPGHFVLFNTVIFIHGEQEMTIVPGDYIDTTTEKNLLVGLVGMTWNYKGHVFVVKGSSLMPIELKGVYKFAGSRNVVDKQCKEDATTTFLSQFPGAVEHTEGEPLISKKSPKHNTAKREYELRPRQSTHKHSLDGPTASNHTHRSKRKEGRSSASKLSKNESHEGDIKPKHQRTTEAATKETEIPSTVVSNPSNASRREYLLQLAIKEQEINRLQQQIVENEFFTRSLIDRKNELQHQADQKQLNIIMQLVIQPDSK